MTNIQPFPRPKRQPPVPVFTAGDFQITNGLTTLYTTNTRELAIAKAKRLKAMFPGIRVEQVEIVERRKVIYRARKPKVLAALTEAMDQ